MHDFAPRESAGEDVAEPLKELEPSVVALAHVMVPEPDGSIVESWSCDDLRAVAAARLRQMCVLAYRRGALDALERAVGGSGS